MMLVLQILALLAVLLLVTYYSFHLYRRQDRPGRDRRILSEEVSFGTQEGRASKLGWKRIAVVCVAIIAGMLTTAVYRTIKESGDIDWQRFRVDFLLTLIVSPLVVRAILGDAEILAIQPVYRIALSGYQNGFFWETIIGELPGN